MKKSKLLVALSMLSVSVFADKLPTVMIIGTGGTIAGKAASQVSGTYKPGEVKVEDLVNNVTGIDKLANLKFEQLYNVGSSNLSLDNMVNLTNAVNKALSDKSISGVVITHGTDTLEETAYFLDLFVKSSKPVVITGSMRPSTSLSADGPMNLYDAVAVAANPASANKGSLVVLNDEIFDGRNVTKSDSENVKAFSANNGGPIGSAYAGDVKYYYSPVRLTTVNTPFKVADLSPMPKVMIIYDYLGSTTELLQKAIDEKVQGIVWAGSGNGSINGNAEELIKKARAAGIIIVRSSRTGKGPVIHNSMDDWDDQYGLFSADNLNPQKARILLIAALSKTNNIDKINQYFAEF